MGDIFKVLCKELKKCNKGKDVPISALLIDNKNKIIAKDYNRRQKKLSFTNHAEINVLNKIYRKTKSKNLGDYFLISTLKPCLMCVAVIEQANIKNVFYYLENIKCNYEKIKTNIKFKKIGIPEELSFLKKELKNFFYNLRK